MAERCVCGHKKKRHLKASLGRGTTCLKKVVRYFYDSDATKEFCWCRQYKPKSAA